uniref:C-type lectin domain-containing protein n=1 Tax=Cyprinodon variegatus TaxID=28743 RepID=A0A3Q2FUF8_CYPVA
MEITKHCVQLELNRRKINQLLLNQRRGSLTQSSNHRPLQRDLAATKRTKTCPTGWTKFSCTCYFVSTKSGSWDEGRKDCITRGADLVVINDKEEQDFISSFANEAAWIGLIDNETEGSWKWVDGTSMTLSFWRDNQPDNWNGDEDCGQYINKQWNDHPCAASLKWICEKLPPWTCCCCPGDGQ